MTALTIVTPTQGRATLERLLDSYAGQMEPGDRALVMVDGFGMDHDSHERIVERVNAYGLAFDVRSHDAGHSCWGHCQLNRGYALAPAGSYVTFNDDDDIYKPGALAAIREAVSLDESPRVHLFRFLTHWGEILPRGVSIGHGQIGGHSLVLPAPGPGVPHWPGFSCMYAGDWDGIRYAVEAAGGVEGGGVVFEDAIISQARPT